MLSLKKVTNKEIEIKADKWNDEIWLVNSGYSIYELTTKINNNDYINK